MRIDGRIRFLQAEPVDQEATHAILDLIAKSRGIKVAPQALDHEIDCAYDLPGVGRFRCNISSQRGYLFFVMRTVSRAVVTFEELSCRRTPWSSSRA